jgi:hypothetical protein
VPGAIAPSRRQRRRRPMTEEESLPIADESSEIGMPAVTPAGGAEDDATRAKPVAAPDPGSSRSRSTGRARRPRPTS